MSQGTKFHSPDTTKKRATAGPENENISFSGCYKENLRGSDSDTNSIEMIALIQFNTTKLW